jgi:hypothetical protein
VIRPKESAMAVAALRRIPLPELKTYHATMLVTRTEEWCVSFSRERAAIFFLGRRREELFDKDAINTGG